MSSFGQEREANDGAVRQVYTGVENFSIQYVNPTHKELQELYGNNAKEDTYLLENEVDGTKYPQIKIVLHGDNLAEEGEPSIKVRPTYWITRAPMVSKEKGTKQYINLYGSTFWMSEEEAAKKLPVYERQGANGSYKWDSSSMRLALRGEAEFIDMLRNLLNLPSPSKANTLEEKKSCASMFSMEDWDKMFKGDFSVIKNIIEGSSNKIGMLMGAKRVDDKVYQEVFTRNTLRQYGKNSGNFDYLLKEKDNAVANGAYGNVEWGPRDCKVRVFDKDAVPTSVDAFAAPKQASTVTSFVPSSEDAFGGS